MNQALTTRVSRWRWLACIEILAAALIGELAMAPPVRAADLYPYEGYRAPYSYQGAAYRSGCCGCEPCGCEPCGCQRCGCGCGYLPRRPVIERHVIDRELYERRYGGYPYPGYGYGPFPYGYGGVRSHGPYPAAYDYYDGPRPPAPVGYPGGYYDGYGE